ncbi:tetratricopeptide repeat protein [Salinicola sp. CPA57]|uniref:tetratricopeptide repeat protein n=1 Tax=Salinicola sp. CPA57 TaxID=1949080 RepID=UPI000DA13456|nr:tetratricopeptide repeat protein [Salinicola sp. CPA57]
MRMLVALIILLWSMNALATTLYNDPTSEDLRDKLRDISFLEIDAKVQKSPEENYLLGMIYLSGSKRHEVPMDRHKALLMLESSWVQDIADAGYALFTIYYYGLGVEKNYETARNYLKKSAGMGYSLSQRSLGYAYYGHKYSEIAEADYKKALFWYECAAEQGDKTSALAIAEIYYLGRGVDKNNKKAFEWLLRSSKLEYGSPTASFASLAKFYEEGIGTDIDLVQAYKYYDLQGSAGAEGKQRLSKQMTKEQIEEARRQSLEWQKEHNVRIGGGFFQMN